MPLTYRGLWGPGTLNISLLSLLPYSTASGRQIPLAAPPGEV